MACATAVGRLMLAGVATCAAASANAEPARVAVRDILSAPFASGLTAAPAGGSLAWIVKLEGARNVWVAQPPEYKAQRLTSYVADDGQDISALTWTPDGTLHARWLLAFEAAADSFDRRLAPAK